MLSCGKKMLFKYKTNNLSIIPFITFVEEIHIELYLFNDQIVFYRQPFIMESPKKNSNN